MTLRTQNPRAVVLRGLAAILAEEPGIELVACATCGEDAIDKYRQYRPDVTLMDLQVPGMSGFDAIRRIRQEAPSAHILVLTMHQGSEDIRRALDAGACGYLFKNSLADHLVGMIRNVHVSDRALAGTALANGPNEPVLSPREVGVMQMIANGMRNKEISTALGISEKTVHTHLRSIFAKFQVHDRTMALAVAVRPVLCVSRNGARNIESHLCCHVAPERRDVRSEPPVDRYAPPLADRKYEGDYRRS